MNPAAILLAVASTGAFLQSAPTHCAAAECKLVNVE
jgi:hypothetical protein